MVRTRSCITGTRCRIKRSRKERSQEKLDYQEQNYKYQKQQAGSDLKLTWKRFGTNFGTRQQDPKEQNDTRNCDWGQTINGTRTALRSGLQTKLDDARNSDRE